MASLLNLKIVTPKGVIWSGEVNSVTLPGIEGELGVLPGHIPLATRISAGELSVQQGTKNFFLAVGDGFVEVFENNVSVLTDMAIQADGIDEAQAILAQQQAEARLKQQLSDEEVAAAQAALAQSAALLRVKKTRVK